MDGVGPNSRAEAADIVGHSHVTLKPVIDLTQNLTYTGYVAPPRLKEQTALQNAGYCTFPSCNRAARKTDFDHMSLRSHFWPTEEHHRGRLTIMNLLLGGPKVTPQRGPAGRSYLVTAGTTTRIDQHGQQHRRRRTNAA